MTSTRSLPVQPEDAVTRKRFGLSWTQIAAAGFASITATVILSFFSISGTLIGAAVFSMASAVGNAVYGQSLRRTQDRVLDVVPFVGKADPASPTVVLPAQDEPEAAPVLPSGESTPGTLSTRAWKRVALTAIAIFAFVLTVVTTVEIVAGRPLTDVLRGDQGSGTSLFGGTSGGDDTPVPAITRTVTPSVVITTPTVTQTAPAVTKTATPSATTTTPPTTAPSTSGTSGTSGAASTAPSSGTPSSSQTPSP